MAVGRANTPTFGYGGGGGTIGRLGRLENQMQSRSGAGDIKALSRTLPRGGRGAGLKQAAMRGFKGQMRGGRRTMRRASR